MYPKLFGIENVSMYDLIGVIGYGILIAFFFIHRKRYFQPLSAEQSLSWWHFPLFLAVQLIAYTFGGTFLAGYLNRGTEFFGYVAISAIGMVLTAAVLAYSPLRWLDRTVPLYLTMAAVLKLSCFCAGCCYGLPWECGLNNARCDEVQFPIQLAEAAAYALLLCLLWWYRGRAGQRFALFLTTYAAVRFAVQFFRGDMPVFSAFHWMSAVFFAIGVMMWVLCGVAGKRNVPRETRGHS